MLSQLSLSWAPEFRHLGCGSDRSVTLLRADHLACVVIGCLQNNLICPVHLLTTERFDCFSSAFY